MGVAGGRSGPARADPLSVAPRSRRPVAPAGPPARIRCPTRASASTCGPVWAASLTSECQDIRATRGAEVGGHLRQRWPARRGQVRQDPHPPPDPREDGHISLGVNTGTLFRRSAACQSAWRPFGRGMAAVVEGRLSVDPSCPGDARSRTGSRHARTGAAACPNRGCLFTRSERPPRWASSCSARP